ncbi:MAG: S8 family serine peptidase [Verrucomicrobiales bacterium]
MADEGAGLLFRAAEAGDVRLLQQVLPGADPNLRDEESRTPLMIAAQEGHFDAARFLLWQGADANIADADGNRAVDYLTPGDNGFAPLNLLLRTYAFVQKEAEVGERPTRPHLVLVNDNFIDYSHPLLQDRYFVNEAEREGEEGEDDDGNGFVDDVYGWNSTEKKPVTPPLRSLLSDEENREFVRDLLSRLEGEEQSSGNLLAVLLGIPAQSGTLSDLYDNPIVRDIGFVELVVEAELNLNDLVFANIVRSSSHGTHVAGIVVEQSGGKALIHTLNHGLRGTPRINQWENPGWIGELADQSETYTDFVASVRAGIVKDASERGRRASAYLRSVGAGLVNMSYSQDRLFFMKLAARLQEIYADKGKDRESMKDHACPIGVDLCTDLALELAVADAAQFALPMAENPDVLFVMAAGNKNENNDSSLPSPAYLSRFFPNAITVASVDSFGEISGFTNYGVRSVQIAAPGEDIKSALLGGGTGVMNGTSQAAPAVAGVAARIRSEHPELTASDLRRIIERSANRESGLAEWVDAGAILDATAALELASRWRPGRESLSDWELSRLGREGEDGPGIGGPSHGETGDVIVSGDSLTPQSWRITAQGGFEGSWRYVMSQGSDRVQQVAFPPEENPWNRTGDFVEEGYELTSLAGDSGKVSVVMSKTERPPRTQVRLGYNQTDLQAAMDDGLAITAISGWKDHWDFILTEETDYGRQRYSLPSGFDETRKEWIAERMAEGYRITHVAGDEAGEDETGSWVVVMTQDSGLEDQVYQGVGTWPEEWIKERHGEGYRITATAGYEDNWVVVMSQATGLGDQEVQHAEEFPKEWIAEQWRD